MPDKVSALPPVLSMPPASSRLQAGVPSGRNKLLSQLGGSYQLGSLLLYAVMIFGAYGAVLFISYGYIDDYLYLYASSTGGLHDLMYPVVAGGRPLYALLLQLAMPQLHRVGDLWVLRLDSLLGITLLAWSLYQTLRRAGMRPVVAWLTPLLITTLPAYQVFAGWSITAFFPYSAIIAGMSVIVIDGAFQESGARRNVQLLGGLGLLVVSITIYQPTAMVFWLFAAIILFVHERSVEQIVQRFAVLVAIMVIALLCDYALSKSLPALLYPHPASFPRGQLVDDVTSKLLFFLQPLLESLNLFHLVDKTHPIPGILVALAVGMLILTGLPRYFQGSWPTRLRKSVLALCLIPLAYLPNLLVAENFGSFRTQVAMSSLIALYAVLAIIGYVQSWPKLSPRVGLVVLTVLVIASTGFAVRDITAEFAIPQHREYQAIVATLQAAPLAKIDHIYVLPSLKSDRLSTEVHHDEFGLPTTAITWYLVPIVTLALDDVAPTDMSRIVIDQATTAPAGAGPGVLVINMHEILQRLQH